MSFLLRGHITQNCHETVSKGRFTCTQIPFFSERDLICLLNLSSATKYISGVVPTRLIFFFFLNVLNTDFFTNTIWISSFNILQNGCSAIRLKLYLRKSACKIYSNTCICGFTLRLPMFDCKQPQYHTHNIHVAIG